MGIFNKKNERNGKEENLNLKKTSSESKKKKGNKQKKENLIKIIEDKGAEKILITPWITEKSHNLIDNQQYIFKVSKNANKESIKQAVKNLYQVVPEKVRIINIPRKKKNIGMKIGFRSGFKKAIIKLKKGDKIEIYE